jgi:hypothetical protein
MGTGEFIMDCSSASFNCGGRVWFEGGGGGGGASAGFEGALETLGTGVEG